MLYVRTLSDLVKRAWSKMNHVLAGDTQPLSENEKEWNRLIAAGGCYDCKKLPKGFAEGPSGGMCTNVFCTQCGQGWNLTPVAQWAERIHKDEKYIAREEP